MGLGLPIIGDLIDGVKDLVSEAIVDKDKKLQINLELAKLADEADKRLHDEMIAQTEVNKAEATHRSIFVAGWRPFIGWTGGLGLAWTFVVGPMAEFLARLFGWAGTMPVLDVTQLMVLVTGMLGFGGLRSYDKQKGTSNDVLVTPATPVAPVKRKKILGITLPENAPWSK